MVMNLKTNTINDWEISYDTLLDLVELFLSETNELQWKDGALSLHLTYNLSFG